MLTSAKLTAGQERYYEHSVAQGLDDYYAGRGESPGVWAGRTAPTLGLSGVVADGQLSQLCKGLDPASGKLLRKPAKQRTITATISGVDMNTPSITFTGPNGWKYTSKVQDTEALAKVKVGDKVDIVWTEAMLVSLERGK